MSKKSSVPAWAYNRDSQSRFAMVYWDMLVSKEYKALPNAAKNMYVACLVNRSSEKGRACLKKHVLEELHERVPTADSALETVELHTYMDKGSGYFVMPAKHAEEYGFNRQQAHVLLKILCDRGFIMTAESNQHRRKVNVYRFIGMWKNRIP